jgi:hypothetical protein
MGDKDGFFLEVFGGEMIERKKEKGSRLDFRAPT